LRRFRSEKFAMTVLFNGIDGWKNAEILLFNR